MLQEHYPITHRLNVTQHLHSVHVIGCWSSNSVWFPGTSSILCVWYAAIAASNALPSSERCFIYYPMAYAGMGYGCSMRVCLILRGRTSSACKRKRSVCAFSYVWRTAHFTETKGIEECAAEFKLLQPYGGSFTDISQSQKWATSCIWEEKRAEKDESRTERNKWLLFMGMLLLCILFTWSEHPECVSVFYLSCPGQFLSVFVPGCFKRDLGSIHYRICEVAVLSLGSLSGGISTWINLNGKKANGVYSFSSGKCYTGTAQMKPSSKLFVNMPTLLCSAHKKMA